MATKKSSLVKKLLTKKMLKESVSEVIEDIADEVSLKLLEDEKRDGKYEYTYEGYFINDIPNEEIPFKTQGELYNLFLTSEEKGYEHTEELTSKEAYEEFYRIFMLSTGIFGEFIPSYSNMLLQLVFKYNINNYSDLKLLLTLIKTSYIDLQLLHRLKEVYGLDIYKEHLFSLLLIC